jgi:hypothetical protein
MDHLDTQVRQVYERIGLALYIVQSIERQLAILLASECEPSTKELTTSQYDDLLESLFSETFGELVSRFRKSVELPSDFGERLQKAREMRNWLVHHYFWERVNQFQTPEGRSAMIQELDQITDQLHALCEDFDQRLVGRLQHGSI